MTSLIPRTTFPDLFRFLDGGWPFSQLVGHHGVRIEEYRDNGNYVLRAELPGVDPGKDVDVAVTGDELTITAERTVERHDKSRSEFSYGSFTRTVRLPGHAVVDKIAARYDAGILEVTVPLAGGTDTQKILVLADNKEVPMVADKKE